MAVRLSWLGADFGVHWDEQGNIVAPALRAVDRGFMLPGKYVYPSVNHWLASAVLAPPRRNGGAAEASPEEFIRLRRLFGFVSLLSIVWVFAAVRIMGRSVWEAALASALLAMSWEIGYHSRWIAPDAVLMQFGAMQLMIIGLAMRSPGTGWLRVSAIVAGVACGTKYPGGLLILPALVLAWRRPRRMMEMAALGAILLGTFLLTTPGVFLEWEAFRYAIVSTSRTYQRGWFGYTVEPVFEHGLRLAQYLAMRAFSPYTLISAVFFAASFVGAAVLWRRSRWTAFVVMVFPAAYLLYFSLQSVMIVRNYLVVLPFLAFLAARGISAAVQLLPRRTMRVPASAAVACLLVVNLHWQAMAAHSIAKRKQAGRSVAEVSRYLEEHKSERFLISNRLAQSLDAIGKWPRENAVVPDAAARGASFSSVIGWYEETIAPRVFQWQAIRPRVVDQPFGPKEVNLNYYPGWWGDDRPVLFEAPQKLGLTADSFLPVARWEVYATLHFPRIIATSKQPLLSSGVLDAYNYLTVEFKAPGRARIFLHRTNIGDTYGPEFSFAPDKAYQVHALQDFKLGHVKVVVDGAPMFVHNGGLHPSMAGELATGRHNVASYYSIQHNFDGEIKIQKNSIQHDTSSR